MAGFQEVKLQGERNWRERVEMGGKAWEMENFGWAMARKRRTNSAGH